MVLYQVGMGFQTHTSDSQQMCFPMCVTNTTGGPGDDFVWLTAMTLSQPQGGVFVCQSPAGATAWWESDE